MSQLNIAFLWHQHQPFYKDEEGDYLLPWVGLHATKDYLDLLVIAGQYPEICQTINLVPSLLLQLKDYADGTANDMVIRLSRKSAAEFSTGDKADILRHFFPGNPATMIQPYPRYKQLYEKYQSIKQLNDSELAGRFSPEELRDLQLWFNLSWIGYESKKDPVVQRLIKKQQNYSDDDRLMLLDYLGKLIKKVIATHAEMWQKDQIDLTTSPFYHPIMPLLCDTEIAKISQQGLELPRPPFRHPEDAVAQLERGLEYFKNTFGRYPSGIWPSEGSVSEEVAEIIASKGISWIATDEDILSRSLNRPFEQDDIYRLYSFKTTAGKLHMFFRDRALSDKIGFVYGSWPAEEAVEDFMNHLAQIKAKIHKAGGDKAVEDSIVPIILDGENCWEYYPENGGKFLHLLYKRLSGNSEFITTTFTKFINKTEPRELKNIWPGSWINHNFQIWIGDSEDRQAWEVLNRTREFLVQGELRKKIPDKIRKQAWEEIYIAEGSDWCWWYGNEHSSGQDSEFDRLFRGHLIRVYQLLGEDPPENLFIQIKKKRVEAFQNIIPKHFVFPVVDGIMQQYFEWYGAASYRDISSKGSMHQTEARIKKIMVGFNDQNLCLAVIPKNSVMQADKVLIRFYSPKKISYLYDLKTNKCELSIEKKDHWEPYSGKSNCALNEVLELMIPFRVLKFKPGEWMRFQIVLKRGNQISLQFPQFNLLELPVPDKSYENRNWMV